MKFIIILLLCIYTSNALVKKIIDLGHDLSHETPIVPLPAFKGLNFNLTVMHAGFFPAGFWVAYNKFSSIEHIGTHVDAPYHFSEHGWTLEQIPVERLITDAIVIDVTSQVQNDSNYLVSIKDVDDWIAAHGPIPNNSVVLIRTGWSKRYPNQIDYYGHDSDLSKAVFPGLDPEAVKRINSLKKEGINIYGFGIDGPSLDNGPSHNFLSHQLTAAENQYIIENMNNLDKLPAKGTNLIVMPMKIKGGSGAPARVVAQLPL